MKVSKLMKPSKKAMPRVSAPRSIAPPTMENLEDRCLLSLIGVNMPGGVPLEYPVMTYNSTGHIAYSASTEIFDETATLLTFRQSPTSPPRNVTGGAGTMLLHMVVDNQGNLLGGGLTSSFTFSGSITGTTFSGVLLTGKVVQFGYADQGATDAYDFRLVPTGGALAGLFAGKDIGIAMTSEGSTFTGAFDGDFLGGAKGTVGAIAPLLSSLAGTVYADANNNGLIDAGEPGIPGTTVTLTGTNLAGQVVNSTALTDGNGAYSFAGLRPGTYTITETQPANYLDGKDTQGTPGTGTAGNDVFSNIVLNAGVNGQNNNFGELSPASLAGNVYFDANDDGTFQPSETGIGGATVALTGTDDLGAAVSLSTTTDELGAYSFGNLRPGTYQLTETQPDGYLDGKDTIGTPGGVTTNDQFSNIALTAGVNGQSNNFGELSPASLAGNVYYDANNDGTFQFGETGIAGATVTLTGTDDLGAAVSLSTATDGQGAYSFANLRPGTYQLNETQPAGYLDGLDTVGTPGGVTANDQFSSIVLNADVDGANNNFGELLPASLAGNVYYDANNNGTFDVGEKGISGATVTLTGTNDLGAAVSLPGQTGADGSYAFTGLRPGTYTITETQPAGYLDGLDTIGTPGGATANDQFSSIVLNAGVNGANNNFGELLAASLAGNVYYDANNNGLFDGSEKGIAGATVALTGSDDLGAAVSLSTTTSGAGAYSFAGLRPGTYQLNETQPAGYLDGKDTIGTPGGATANDQFSNIVLNAGVNGANNNFGELLAASLAGNVYYDANNDGTFQPTEIGIAGVTVTLTGTNDLGAAVNLSTSTNGAGAYSFANLRPGTYQLNETQPLAYQDGKDTLGTPGGTVGNDVFSNIVLNAGVSGQNNNFGETQVGALHFGSIGDFVWHDTYHGTANLVDGIQNFGEAGIGGVAMDLLDAQGNVIASTVTNSSGFYVFANLTAGTYFVQVAPKSFQTGVLADHWYASPADKGANDAIDSDGNTVTHRSGAILLAEGQENMTIDFGFFHTGIDLTKTGPGTVQAGQVITYHFVVVNTGDVVEHGGAHVYDAMLNPCGDHEIWSDVLQPGQVVTFDRTYQTKAPSKCGGQGDVGTLVNTSTAVGHPIGPDSSALPLVTDASSWTVQVVTPPPPPATLGDRVWLDADRDGIQDCGEAGVQGVTVKLYQPGPDGQAGTADDVLVGTTTTDSAGGYTFTGLAAGTYFAQFAAPTGLDFTTPGQGSDRAADSNAAVATGRTGLVSLTAGQVDRTIDAGLVTPVQAAWEGLTTGYWKQSQHFGDWTDYSPCDKYNQVFGVNAPGCRTLLQALQLTGGGEQAMARQAVAALLNAANPEINYYYSVDEVIAMVRQAYSTGQYEQAKNLLAAQNELELSNGGSLGGGGCGSALSSIGGFVYLDKDNDGKKDCGESGIAGVAIVLTGVDDWGHQVRKTILTNRDGKYCFTGLKAGMYTVTESQPCNYRDGKDTLGNAGGALCNDRFAQVDLLANTTAINYNFGERTRC